MTWLISGLEFMARGQSCSPELGLLKEMVLGFFFGSRLFGPPSRISRTSTMFSDHAEP